MNRWVLVSMVLLVALSGCRNRYATVSEDLLPLAKELSPDRLFSEVLVRHDKDTSAQMKAMAYVSLGGNTARSRVQIRWARDRALQISILPLMGVEICRMVLTPDTVYLIDRYHKQYVKESVDEWQGQSSMDISFGSIQSLFLARPFLPGGKTLPDDVSLFDVAAVGEGYRYTYSPGLPACDYHFEIDNRACLGAVLWNTPSSSRSLVCRYAGYHMVEESVSPTQMTFALSGFFSEPVSFFFEKMEFDWNTPQNISMAVSLQYKRTDLQTWIETILR